MDKKSLNRSSQSQSRASAVDCKKNTDLTHKPWPRNNRKREGSNNTPKNEPYRKNALSQRGRGPVDRKPRPRGSSGFLVGGASSTGIEEDDEPEIGSVLVPGSKKQNLNHLLNFMYPTRGGQERRGGQPQPRRQGQRVSYRHEHDLYLRAYCQFILKEDGDYKANLLDPDVPVKWDQIEEIVVRSTGRSECPICLGVSSAGRAGPCGHVYCWGCVLHYTAAHEKQPPPCPVCATPLHVQDMKPTRMVQWEPPAEEVTMRLVRRLRGSTIVEIAPPRGQLTDSKPTAILPLETINNAPYSKFFTATKKQVQEILERERMEIQNQILAEIDTTEIIYLEQALNLLKLKEEKLNTVVDKLEIVQTVTEKAVPTVYEKQEVNKNKIDWFDVTEEGAASIEVIQDQMEELGIETSQSNLNPEAPAFNQSDTDDKILEMEEFPLTEDLPTLELDEIVNNPTVTDIDKENQTKYFYFYQAEDGQLVFLNKLNVRILNSSWGALSAAPPIIRGRVLQRETFPLIEQTRKHMPCTAHLPLHCSFDIVELDLQPPYVTTVALNNFAEELERRARNRARQQREERRRERAHRRAVDGPPKPDFSSEVLFPPAAPSYSSQIVDVPLPSLDESGSTTSTMSPPSSGPSFAKMASTSGTWRVRKAAAPPSPSPADDDDGLVPRTLSLSDAIEAALHAAPSSTNKKNKKNKPKALYSKSIKIPLNLT